MWSDGGPAQPSPTIGQAMNGGFPDIQRPSSATQAWSIGDDALGHASASEVRRAPVTNIRNTSSPH